MREHTPGPWEVQLANAGARVVQSANGVGPKAKVICSGLSGNRANARLIAAAPDLLNAILHSDNAHWTPAMRAAIAKATGAA